MDGFARKGDYVRSGGDIDASVMERVSDGVSRYLISYTLTDMHFLWSHVMVS